MFNELEELTKITARSLGFGINAIKFTPSALDEISGAVLKTDTVDKLTVVLCTVTDEILLLNKIVEALMTNPKKSDKCQKDCDPKSAA